MKRTTVAVVLSCCCVSALAQSDDVQKKINEILYGGAKRVQEFGFIHVHIKNDNDGKFGLKSEELSEFLRLRFKNSFASVPYRPAGNALGRKDPDTTGYLWCGVWTVGDTYPVAYHVECKMGPLSKPTMFTDASLGFGSDKNVASSIRGALDDMTTRFATDFFKARGEL